MPFTIDVEPANYVQLDMFPSSVYPENDSNPPIGEEFRVIVTDNYFYAIVDGSTGPYAQISEPLVRFEGSNKTGYTVTTETNVYFVRRATNCGCGSRVRGVHPFAGVPYVPLR